MVQIELGDNNSTNWTYSLEEFKKAQEFSKMGYKTNIKEIELIRSKEKSWKKNKKEKK